MTKLAMHLVDLIFPRRCPLCNEIVIPKDKKACIACTDKLQPIEEPSCKKCNKPMMIEEQEYCYDCVKSEHHYERGFAIYVYEGRIKKALLDYKYQGKQEFASFFIDQIIYYAGERLRRLSVDLIVAVPLHSRKHRMRGFNQAQLIAQGIGEFLKVPVCTNLLIRTKYTTPQKKLNDKERLQNLERAFAVNQGSIPYQSGLHQKKILIVDDIYTTGSTIEACTKTLIKADCGKVYFVTVCVGKGF